MVDNKEIIKPLLIFPNKDCFYFVQIIQRKKDHKGERLGGSNNNSRLIKAYYIKSIDQLEIHWEEMVKLAEVFNARVSINLNPRNFRKAAFHTIQKIANQMSNDVFNEVHKAYNSVCGEYHSEMDKRWILDIDKEDLPKFDEILQFVQDLHDEIQNRDYNILAVLPTKSGKHIITNPFNLDKFSKKYPEISVHKNNPVNCYIPDELPKQES